MPPFGTPTALAAPTVDDLRAFIREKIEQHYEQEHAGMLLQNLGWAIFNERPELRLVLGNQKLRAFIEAAMPGEVRVVPSPLRRLDYWAFPAHVLVDPANPDLFRVADSIRARRRYSKAIWSAFTQPLAPDRQRIIRLQPYAHYEDVPQDQPPSEGYLTVDRALIIPDHGTDPASHERISANISAWMDAHGVGGEYVSQPPPAPPPPPPSPTASRSLFDALSSALDDSELKRCSLPLDVVRKLQRTPA